MAITKQFLSGGTANGRPIKIAAVATAGTLIHTAHATSKDELSIYFSNTSDNDEEVIVEFGGTTSPDDRIKFTVPANETILGIPGIPLSGGLVVRAFAETTNVVTAFGYVNRIG